MGQSHKKCDKSFDLLCLEKSTLKVAYILGAFPVLSETFILNEIIELKKLGLDIVIFSYLKVNEDFVHKDAMELGRDTIYLTGSKFKKAYSYLFTHLYLLITDPFRYLKALWFAYNKGLVFRVFKGSAFYALAFKKLNVRHIHAHFAGANSEVAMLASMLSGIPYSFTAHAHDIYLDLRLTKQQIEFAEFVVTVCEYNKRLIKERYPGINGDKIQIIPCGVNVRKPAISMFDDNRVKRSFVILSIGRLVEIKGIKYLLEACSILGKMGISGFVCKIVGDGPLKDDLKGLSLRLGLTDVVRFLGPLPSDKVSSLLEEADLFVLPSVISKDGNMDSMPVVLKEAMASGKPVISTYVSGIPELVKHGAGILVPPNDSKALAEAIEEIYSMDLEARKRMGQKGREIVEREFDIEKECRKLMDLFVKSFDEIDGSAFKSSPV